MKDVCNAITDGKCSQCLSGCPLRLLPGTIVLVVDINRSPTQPVGWILCAAVNALDKYSEQILLSFTNSLPCVCMYVLFKSA